MDDEARACMLRENYGRAGPEIVSRLLEILVAARRRLGDADSYLIYLSILMRTISSPGFALAPAVQGEVERVPALGINVNSIAESTGIPRETVRRKVLELIAKGYVERRDSALAVTPKALREMEAVREASLEAARRWARLVIRLDEAARPGEGRCFNAPER